MCAINMKTRGGGNCHADVTCADGAKRDYDNWNVCFLGGEQHFSDPGIGEFSITFTQKDDDCGDGLCSPVLKLKDVGNWTPIDVHALSEAAAHNAHFVGTGDPSPFANPDSRNICASTTDYNNDGRSNVCGIPAIGKAYGPGGLDSQGPVNDRGYAPGWCGLHVTQHQKVNPSDPNSHYKFDITIKDSNEDVIGSVSGADAPANVGVGVTSKLPWVVVVTAQNVDADPVLMAYSDQSWAYADAAHHCNFGAYDSGKREGDCGFSC